MRPACVMRHGAIGLLLLALGWPLGAGAAVAAAKPAAPGNAAPQELKKFDRDRARMMLKIVRDDLERFYYDPQFRGLDLDASFKIASDRIDAATSMSQLFAGIARPLLELRDSHTRFYPPVRSAKVHFGWLMQMIGEDCYVTGVQQGSDAEAKGLKPGDQILTIDARRPTRDSAWAIKYVFQVIAPKPEFELSVKSPGGEPRSLTVKARLEPQMRVASLLDKIQEEENQRAKHKFVKYGPPLLVWRVPQFDLPPADVTNFMREVRDHKAVVLDLRGNPGGSIETLERMVGAFAGEGVKIGDVKSREEMKPVVSKKAGDVYDGQVIVLIDSDSGSAAELMARMMQLTGRAKVFGDRSAGAVMMSRSYSHVVGDESGAIFASSITIADIIMSDGKSLENHGVTPDTVMLPTPQDIAAGRDPVLAHVAGLCGVTITPEQAGELFPIEWEK